MAASQVEEMKRVYAGIMLNMAQESAARVLAAEQRAAALAGAVTAAKEDGVAALVRLKAIMDARIKEAELLSSQLVKKIKELEEQQSLQHVKMKGLEDQLYDAQNNVATLQTELLQRSNAELEQTRKTFAEERINCLPTSKKIGSNKHTSSHLKMNLQSRSMSLNNKNSAEDTTAEENVATQNIESINRRSPDLPSFMERNKKPKLYHNGCTQRIHALKQRTQGADACQEQKCKYATALNSRSKVRKNDAAKKPSHTRSIMEQILQTKFLGKCKRKRGTRSRPCYKQDSSGSGERREAEYNLSETSNGNGCLLLLQALEQDLSSPKVSSGHVGEALTDLKDDSVTNRVADLNLHNGSLELIDILAPKNMLVKRKKRSKTVRVLEADFSDSISVPESSNTLLRSTSEKSMSDAELISVSKDNHSDTPPRNSGPVLQHIAENLMDQTGANNGKSLCENKSAVLLQSTKSEAIDYGNLLVEQPGHKTPDTNTASSKEVNGEGSCSLASEKADASTVISPGKEENLKVSSVLPMQASEKPNASVGSFLFKEEHAKASSGASMQVEGVRQIIYTFNRRKCKSVPMDSSPLRAVPEKSSNMLSAPTDGEFHPNPEQQENLIDSSHGDNQLVQVAEQLILLSECNC